MQFKKSNYIERKNWRELEWNKEFEFELNFRYIFIYLFEKCMN